MIRLSNIRKSYRGDVDTLALADVTMSVGRGEFLAVMGPSGCGKSTLLNILGFLDVADAGEYLFEGEDVSHLSERRLTEYRKTSVGFVFQNYQLVEDLSAAENVGLILAYQDVPRRQRKAMVEEALERVGLFERRNARPAQLSGGQQQRVALARALVSRPRLILADEPTGNLDSRNGDEIMDILSRLNAEGSTIVMVTHSPTHAARAARIVHMLDGGLVDAARAEL
jgi:putative ABC transport system ATP-binding protein